MNQRNSRNQIHVHIDADAFFTSVEQVLHRELQGKAIVVGQNGGIVSALSYPAKDLGVTRVSPIVTVRKNYPSVQIVSSDFHAYGLFSKRMQRIIRRHLPDLVQNSVDEGASEIGKWVSGFSEAEKLVEKLQKELYLKLGCTFSFGLARTPLLAKLASGMNKPEGITILNDENIQERIYHAPVNKLSGVGQQGYKKLQENGINTIGDFAKAKPAWLQSVFSISMPALQNQVLGEVVSIPKQKEGIKSMSRDRSFPATSAYDYLYSQASMNVEHLSQRMRKEGLFTKRIGLRIRDSKLRHTQSFITLISPSREPELLLAEVDNLLKNLYQKGVLYRQVSITCAGLSDRAPQNDLFGEVENSDSKDRIFHMMDDLESMFGKSCISLASSLQAEDNLGKIYSRHVEGDTYPHELLPGEEIKKRLEYPFLGIVR